MPKLISFNLGLEIQSGVVDVVYNVMGIDLSICVYQQLQQVYLLRIVFEEFYPHKRKESSSSLSRVSQSVSRLMKKIQVPLLSGVKGLSRQSGGSLCHLLLPQLVEDKKPTARSQKLQYLYQSSITCMFFIGRFAAKSSKIPHPRHMTWQGGRLEVYDLGCEILIVAEG